jgi:superfamily I DNA and/or RNA helicase
MCALVEDRLREAPVTPNQITVLTQYRDQMHLYYNLLGSNGLQGVRIHIVDSFALSDIVESSTY